MANNRMWLRCQHCDAEHLLAKYYPTITNRWFVKVNPGKDSMVEAAADTLLRLEEFLQRHSYCPVGSPTMDGNTGFVLRFEEQG